MLLNNEFADENGMVPVPATVVMKTVGGIDSLLDIKIYEFNLIERNGTSRKVWVGWPKISQI